MIFDLCMEPTKMWIRLIGVNLVTDCIREGAGEGEVAASRAPEGGGHARRWGPCGPRL